MSEHCEGKFNKGNMIGSYLVPIEGDASNGSVQVDLMFVPSIPWAKFSYFSPGDKSEYKGSVRTCLLMGIAAAFEHPEYTYFKNEAGLLTFRCGLTFDLNEGLRTIYQCRKTNKNGDYLSTLKTIEYEEALEKFPSELKKIEPIKITSPERAMWTLFLNDETFFPFDFDTAEDVIGIIKNVFDEEHQERVFKFASLRAYGIKDKTTLPPEILNCYK